MSSLTELQTWYRAQCDGEWEHYRGVRIESTDNPGWWVKIDVQGTTLADRAFAPVQRGDFDSMDPQPPWLTCKIEDGVFHGAGDASTLAEILELFLSWAAVVPPPSQGE
jgi:hypothetical protein